MLMIAAAMLPPPLAIFQRLMIRPFFILLAGFQRYYRRH